MVNYYFQYDMSTGVVYPYLQQNAPASSDTTGVLGPYPQSSASPDVVMAYNFPERYLAQGSPVALVEQPYFTTAASQNGATWTVTATLNNPPATAPTEVTFTVAGSQFTASLTSGVASFSVAVHPSVSIAQFTVTASAAGCATSRPQVIGGNAPASIPVQVVTPSGGVPTIGPSGADAVKYLQSFYALNNTSVEALLTNALTGISLLYDAVFNVLLPAAQQAAYAPVALDANQTSAVAALKSGILGTLPTTLENGEPSGGTEQMQFGAFVQNFQSAAQNVTNFMQALTLFNL